MIFFLLWNAKQIFHISISNLIWFFPFEICLDNENEKFSTLPPSSHGSLSSITTTSITSSEDPKGGDHDGKDFDRKPSKVVAHHMVKQEEWWKTTLQVSIPFLIAGLGTIGAGIILGRVEVGFFILFFFFFEFISETFLLIILSC